MTIQIARPMPLAGLMSRGERWVGLRGTSVPVRGRTIRRAADFVGVVLVSVIFLAVAAAGAAMIAVPVPILLHFLSQYGGVTGTAAMMICRLPGVTVLVLALLAGLRSLARFR
jgi:hypothetical protein